MKCTDCAYYVICKDLIKAGFTGVNETFPEIEGCEVFELNPEHEVKEGEKKNATSSINRVTSYPCRSRLQGA